VLLQDRTATQRAEETHTPPETVGTLKRRFEPQGMLGLVPDSIEIVPSGRRRRGPKAVVQELQRLTSLYDGFQYRELARIIFSKWDYRMTHHTVQRLLQQLPSPSPRQLPWLDYPSYPERAQARLQVIQRHVQGWRKTSSSRFVHVSRPTINEGIDRFASDN
jgi:hypothetical protein